METITAHNLKDLVKLASTKGKRIVVFRILTDGNYKGVIK